MNPATIERLGAVIGGIVVAFVALYALYKDWKTPGVENQVFKLMLLLLGVGGIIALLAGLNVLGYAPPVKT
jgi:F0F1-type ATP synthase membrane subunit c/vacuolar-type H+-ATPase subunit K